MRTSKYISTISYNTPEFLEFKLNQLLCDGIIEYWMYIKHYPEEDETKEHIHLYVQPNCMIDTVKLGLEFVELCNDPLPLKCIFWKKSDPDHWILYDQHYADYLASKGESRIYHYSKSDFRYSDQDSFEVLYHHAFYGSDWAINNQILEKLRDDNVSPADLVLSGLVSWTQSSQINALAHMKEKFGTTYRNGRPGHD